MKKDSENDENTSDEESVSVNLESFDLVADIEKTKLKEMALMDRINQLAGNYKSVNSQAEYFSDREYQTPGTIFPSNYDTFKGKFSKDDITTMDGMSEKRKPHFLSETITPQQESPTLRKPRGLT